MTKNEWKGWTKKQLKSYLEFWERQTGPYAACTCYTVGPERCYCSAEQSEAKRANRIQSLRNEIKRRA